MVDIELMLCYTWHSWDTVTYFIEKDIKILQNKIAFQGHLAQLISKPYLNLLLLTCWAPCYMLHYTTDWWRYFLSWDWNNKSLIIWGFHELFLSLSLFPLTAPTPCLKSLLQIFTWRLPLTVFPYLNETILQEQMPRTHLACLDSIFRNLRVLI